MQDSQAVERVKKIHSQYVGFAEEKDYDEIIFSIGELTSKKGEEFTAAFLNFQDDKDKTLIHHIIENPQNGRRPGLWAVIELHLNGASLNLQDNLGNTALHSCANLYSHIIGCCEERALTKEAGYITDLHALNVGSPKRVLDELVMAAAMADVGALLLCGAKPSTDNLKNETVWDILSTTASKMQPTSTKPLVNEASCKRAFFAFFDREKRNFSHSDISDTTAYPWAPNVVSWAEKQRVALPAVKETGGCVLF